MTTEEQHTRASVVIDGFTDDYDRVDNDNVYNDTVTLNRRYEQEIFERTQHRYQEQIYNVTYREGYVQGSNSETDIQQGFDHGYQIAITLGYLLSTIQMLIYGTVQKYNRLFPVSSISPFVSDDVQLRIHHNLQHIEILKKQLFQQLPEALYYPDASTIALSVPCVTVSSSVSLSSSSLSSLIDPKDSAGSITQPTSSSTSPPTKVRTPVDILKHMHNVLLGTESLVCSNDDSSTSSLSILGSNERRLSSSSSSSSSSSAQATALHHTPTISPDDTSKLKETASTIPLSNLMTKITELRKCIQETNNLLTAINQTK